MCIIELLKHLGYFFFLDEYYNNQMAHYRKTHRKNRRGGRKTRRARSHRKH